MDFALTPDQQSLQKAAIAFAQNELNHRMIERDAERAFSHSHGGLRLWLPGSGIVVLDQRAYVDQFDSNPQIRCRRAEEEVFARIV